MQALVVLGILGVVIVLLVTERLRADVVAMLSLAALVVFRILPPERALSGFSSPATVTVACMFVLSAGLKESGFVRVLGDRLLRHGPSSEWGLLLVVALLIGPISAFINNTAAVAVFLPIVMQVCRGHGVSPSKVLMPMAFFAILGGTCTLIGTSTNILVTSMAAARGVRPFGMFEFSPLGLVVFAVGAVYLLVVGRRMLPPRVEAEPRVEGSSLTRYLGEVRVVSGSPLVGRTLVEAAVAERYGIEVLGVVGAGGVAVPAVDPPRLAAGDTLLVKASARTLVGLPPAAGLAVRTGKHLSDADLRAVDSVVLRAVVPPNSRLEGRTVKGVDFRNRYGATALALHRVGEEVVDTVGRVRLRVGDELLVLAPRANLDRLRAQGDLLVLTEEDSPLPPAKAVVAAATVAGVVTTAATGVLPVAAAALVGCAVLVLTGCLPAHKVHESVDWKVVVLLGAIIPLGAALESSGAAAEAVRGILWLVGDRGPRVVLGAFTLATYLLTGFMSNNATAALMVPIVLSTAQAMGVDGRPFLVAVMFAASAAFYTPVGYQTNLLVYGPGGYRFGDYTRVGGPLNLVFWAIVTLLTPVLFPF